MSRVLSVARMVFKKKSLSPAYYWMIIAPIMVAIIGFGFVKYMQQQSKAERPVIAVVADNNIKKVLASKKSTAYQINKKIDTSNSKRLKVYLADGVLDGILYVNQDISKITYKYNANSQAAVPTDAIKSDLASLRSQTVAAGYGLSAKQWTNLVRSPTVKRKAINRASTVRLKNSETAQNFRNHSLWEQEIANFLPRAAFLTAKIYRKFENSTLRIKSIAVLYKHQISPSMD